MKRQVIGPFSQILTMDKLPAAGPIKDSDLEIIENGAVIIHEGLIEAVGSYEELIKHGHIVHDIDEPGVLIPGFIDSHTHLCYAGNRASDYAARLSGKSYQDIAANGGGILDTVRKTRQASKEELITSMEKRIESAEQLGVTTIEIKSGYGLNVQDEIKQLEAIRDVTKRVQLSVVSTCLAAHVVPTEFRSASDYLNFLVKELLTKIQNLTKRVDVFVDAGAFTVDQARSYLEQAKKLGFSFMLHADQFTRGGAQLGAELHAVSVDHLEASNDSDFLALKKNKVIPIVLPGATLGLGIPFPPARKLLDHGLPLVIASDWNPGSAPMGNLLMQAAVLGAAEHLSMAETLAALTARAAPALQLHDRGILKPGFRADMIAFPCRDFREILYHQGSMLPSYIYMQGLPYPFKI